MLAARVALVAVCMTSAVTAILALSSGDRTSGVLQRAGDDVAAVDALRMALSLAQAGERVVLADDGLPRFRELTREADQARQQLRARARGTALVSDVDNVDRTAGDLQLAVDRAARAATDDPRAAFVAYRDAIRSARDAVDASTAKLVRKLVALRDDSSQRSARVASRARWTLVAMAGLSVVMSIVFAGGARRAPPRPRQRTQTVELGHSPGDAATLIDAEVMAVPSEPVLLGEPASSAKPGAAS